ncbi:hypothetical protein C5167_021102 [Papaver somniferum]|uniref:Uncharacterized protein n=1 Tax=Papaver somniferum TaxID=3469 RepID=A0A4Y7IZ29_PAPSO|nr:hypothetical protein C5167_021102 [Papaver somniferum]
MADPWMSLEKWVPRGSSLALCSHLGCVGTNQETRNMLYPKVHPGNIYRIRGILFAIPRVMLPQN